MRTIADVRQQNAAAGQYFFSRETMKWWSSRVESPLYKDRYFITSEQMPEAKRAYTVREALPDGKVQSVGSSFQQFKTKAGAREFIKTL